MRKDSLIPSLLGIPPNSNKPGTAFSQLFSLIRLCAGPPSTPWPRAVAMKDLLPLAPTQFSRRAAYSRRDQTCAGEIGGSRRAPTAI